MNLCAKCAAAGPTCCQQREIFLTDGDLLRIFKATGNADFFEYRKPADASYLESDDDDPNWLIYTSRADGSRRVLRHLANGDCTFLTQTGCSLSLISRPLICRLHPSMYNEQGLTGVAAGCPGHLLEEGRDVVEAVGMTLHEAGQWRQMLYTELRCGRPADLCGS